MNSSLRNYAFFAAVLTWLAVWMQFYFLMKGNTGSILKAVTQFLGYFTIIANIAVALCFTGFFLKGEWKNFLTRPGTQSAVTLYILIVGIVYNLVLRSIWHPQGLQKLSDEILHSVSPLMMLFFWIIYVPKFTLQWQDIKHWLKLPVAYFTYVMVRGVITGFYPYPFINVTRLGYAKVMMNGGLLLLFFVVLSLVLIGIAKRFSPKEAVA
ncbi:MAG: Pr6Pr family membrane protein [Bacteroidetes bacterium]|nr:Pr6Pr family membrane protein [Bacteroidota bacterium]